MTNILFRSIMAAGTLLVAAPASAAVTVPSNVFTFNTSVAASSASGSGAGNTRTYAATTNSNLTMKVSAWTLTPDKSSTYFSFLDWRFMTAVTPGSVKATTLAAYTVGLGDLGDGENTNDATHTIDNDINNDFLLLEFNEAVTLSSINLNVYSLDGRTQDSDALVAWGMTKGGVDAAGLTKTGLDGLFAGSQEVLGGSASGSRLLDLPGKQGNLWMIGASRLNADGITDGFKLAGLTVTTAVTAVPEPATWAMMLVGFGMVGGAARYRRRKTTVAIA